MARVPARRAVADAAGAAVILSAVHLIFTSLLVIMAIATLWFAGYVVYRLYSDQR